MRVVFRVDASFQIGMGHVMRCLTLANILREQGAEISFICREHLGNMCDYIEKKNYTVFRLSINESFRENHSWLGASLELEKLQTIQILKKLDKVDLVVVDHYSIDKAWEQAVRPHTKRIMVIDDLANRYHDCDILLDQNLYRNMESRYQDIVPEGCILLLGPKHALLRPEFVEKRNLLRIRNGEIQRILIFYGGSDPTNETTKAMKAIDKLGFRNVTVDVVVGSSNLNKQKIEQLCDKHFNFKFHYQIDYIAELMLNADLSLGAGGSTTWERCFLGLPSVVTVVAENQLEATLLVADEGAIWSLGLHNEVKVKDLVQAIQKAKNNPEGLVKMSESALKLMELGSKENQLSVEEVIWRCVGC